MVYCKAVKPESGGVLIMDQTGRTRAASVARVLCFGVLMTVLVAAELYLHYKTIPVFLDYLR